MLVLNTGMLLFVMDTDVIYGACGWLSSRVVSVLDSGAEEPGFKLQQRCCRITACNSLRQTVHINRASVHEAAKLVAALLRVARVTADLA